MICTFKRVALFCFVLFLFGQRYWGCCCGESVLRGGAGRAIWLGFKHETHILVLGSDGLAQERDKASLHKSSLRKSNSSKDKLNLTLGRDMSGLSTSYPKSHPGVTEL